MRIIHALTQQDVSDISKHCGMPPFHRKQMVRAIAALQVAVATEPQQFRTQTASVTVKLMTTATEVVGETTKEIPIVKADSKYENVRSNSAFPIAADVEMGLSSANEITRRWKGEL